jgi:tryptophan synthase beta chain
MLERGYYGDFGGAYIPEILVATFDELVDAFAQAKADPAFLLEFETLMSTYSCRPTPLTDAPNLTRHFGGARIFIKREDLNHTGAHKANNVMGQGLLVRRMGKQRVIAETGAGQHGVATATMAARFGLACTVYMGEVDVHRQRPNVFWMERLGAEVVAVTEGTRILKDAINEAFRDWVTNMDTTHYVLGTACGPHPFPEMVTWFQSIIGREGTEARTQWASSAASSRMKTWSWWGSRPEAAASSRASTLRGWPPPTRASASPRATRPTSSRTTTARCARPTASRRASTTWASRRSWPT